MSNVISLLVQLAESSRPVTAHAIQTLAVDASPDVSDALISCDVEALKTVAGARATVACLVFTPDDSDESLPEREPGDSEPQPDEPESRAA